jgi:hypothetical protein
MNTFDTNLRTGEWVEVKTPAEISQTLDADGTLDGLPFMPEMLEYCGRRFRVERRAEKTCIEFPGGGYKIREFRENDVVLLEGLRCTGASHDGCQRACMLFWKSDWLQKVDTGSAGPRNSVNGEPSLSKVLKTSSGGRYFCQSTELPSSTRTLERSRILAKCFAEIQSGSRSLFEMAWLVFLPLWRKATSKIPRKRLVGDLKRTPVGSLDLKPGDWVQIKSEDEIAKTLDANGRNRGMFCDRGMCRYSGGKYRVRSRLERMIAEPTGEMRRVESTVILDGLHCLCWNTLGGCPRKDFMYWREIWLDRIQPESDIQDCPADAKQLRSSTLGKTNV